MKSIRLHGEISSAGAVIRWWMLCGGPLLILLVLASAADSSNPVSGEDMPGIDAPIVVVNPSFESVQIGPPFISSNPADVPGWTHGGMGEGPLWAVGYTDVQGTVTIAGAGKQFVTLGGGFTGVGFASWTQTISGFVPRGRYTLTFMMATEGETPSQSLDVSFPAGSHTLGKTFTSGPSSALYWRNWEQKSMTFVASASSVTIQFSVTAQYDVGLDNVSIVRIR